MQGSKAKRGTMEDVQLKTRREDESPQRKREEDA
jgi:hypothetical protein